MAEKLHAKGLASAEEVVGRGNTLSQQVRYMYTHAISGSCIYKLLPVDGVGVNSTQLFNGATPK